ncbi:MAG: DNA gyrase/topoisomerase IV subunit A, partial [Flavobacteriaceae bacterium]
KKMFYIKRFEIGVLKGDQKYVEIAKNIQVEMVSTDWKPVIELVYKGKKPLEKENINVAEFIAVKGIKAIGNQLSRKEVKEINILESIPYIPEKKELNEIEVVQEKTQVEENNEDDPGSQASFDF